MSLGRKQFRFLVFSVVMVMLAVCMLACDAWAKDISPSKVCTTPEGIGNITVMSTLTQSIQQVLSTLTQQMFIGITSDSSFINAGEAGLTIYVIIYGILFTFGMVDMTLYDFAKRMVKIAIVITLFTGTAWEYFDEIVVPFFNNGTDELINVVTNVAINGTSTQIQPGGPPFAALDNVINKAVSVNMIDTLLAVLSTGPYGVIMGALLFMSIGSFVKAILTALWVYLMSMVVRTLLFGVAPIFLSCMLFDRTKNLFEGWLNQVVNACLQPILLFAFLAFFIQIIGSTMDGVMQTPVCWVELKSEHIRGDSAAGRYWRFEVCKTPGDSSTCSPFDGQWSSTGPDNPTDMLTGATITLPKNAPPFPISTVTILAFLLLSQMVNRIHQITAQIAVSLSGASLNLADMQGAASDAFGGKSAPGGAAGKTASGAAAGIRPAPGSSAGAAAGKTASGGTADVPTGGAGTARTQASVNTGGRPTPN